MSWMLPAMFVADVSHACMHHIPATAATRLATNAQVLPAVITDLLSVGVIRYFEEGADEVAFLNITGFRDCPLSDLPMLQVLQAASERVFVPLTVGGGIRGFTGAGKEYNALEVASAYFR